MSKILLTIGLDGQWLTLEITEQALVRDTEQALVTLRGLQARSGSRWPSTTSAPGTARSRNSSRCRWTTSRSTGASSGTWAHNSDDLAIVRSIIGLARSFGLQLVAEGVETEIAAATLVALGCTRAQGFLFAGPRPPTEIEPMIASGICPAMFDLDSGDTVETPFIPLIQSTAGYDGPAAPTTAARRFRPPIH